MENISREAMYQLLQAGISEAECVSYLFTQLGTLSTAKEYLSQVKLKIEECLSQAPPSLPEDLQKEILQKIIRHQETSTLLSQAPNLATHDVQNWLRHCQQLINDASVEREANEKPLELDVQLRILLSANKKIQAVKLAREVLQIGLKDAKDYVEAL